METKPDYYTKMQKILSKC